MNRDVIFLEDEDRERFLSAVRAARDASGFSVLAYCLMENHVHLVLRVGREPVGCGVRRFAVRYAGWFNRKYDRVGHLFQDRFKSVPVDGDAHLVALLRYVWNNPVEAGLVDDPNAYPWSSRRLFGVPSPLIDSELLAHLVPVDPLGTDRAAPLPVWELPTRTGPRSRYSDNEVVQMVEEACGVGSPSDFLSLDPEEQRRAVHQLRLRSVPFAQVARHTGLSCSKVKRMQARAA